MAFERTGGEVPYSGRVVDVRVDRFLHDDGEEVTREYIHHPGAVAVLAHDDRQLWLVAQPREAVGEEALLELPAGKLDREEESPLETAKRELAEEIGKGARTWDRLATFYASPGFSDEMFHLYRARDLFDASAESTENERIEVRSVPLDRLDETIAACCDGKSLVGLLWLKAELGSGR